MQACWSKTSLIESAPKCFIVNKGADWLFSCEEAFMSMAAFGVFFGCEAGLFTIQSSGGTFSNSGIQGETFSNSGIQGDTLYGTGRSFILFGFSGSQFWFWEGLHMILTCFVS